MVTIYWKRCQTLITCVIVVSVFVMLFPVYKIILIELFGENYNSYLLKKYTVDINSSKNEHAKILTLFTTFKDGPERHKINDNTIRFWAQLPHVIPVMFVTKDNSKELSSKAAKLGWTVFEAPRVREGVPVIKSMFQHILQHVKQTTQYIGYANSDIVFSKGLLHTIQLVNDSFSDQLKEKGVFITGRRRNTLLSSIKFDINLQLIGDLTSEQYIFDEAFTLDYFLFTRDHFPWNSVPDFIVGKPGYDNWLTATAVKIGMITVDASLSVPAIHQVENVLNKIEGWHSNKVCMNRDLIDPYNYHPGRTYCLPYYTVEQGVEHKYSISQYSLYHRSAHKFLCNPLFSSTSFCSDVIKKLQNDINESDIYPK